MIKEKILDIINGPSESEPIYLLEFKYRQLETEEEKNEFLFIVQSLAINGTLKEKFASLVLIDLIGKAKESEDIIMECAESIDFSKENQLIPYLVFHCAEINSKWSINFIKRVIKEFRPPVTQRDRNYDSAIRALIETQDWYDAIPEIDSSLEHYSNEYFIDIIAWFIWKRGIYDLNELKEKLSPQNIAKMKTLQAKIDERYLSHYSKFSSEK